MDKACYLTQRDCPNGFELDARNCTMCKCKESKFQFHYLLQLDVTMFTANDPMLKITIKQAY